METGSTGTRLEPSLRRADAILAISEATAADAVERLRIPERRVTVVGTGVSRNGSHHPLAGRLPWRPFESQFPGCNRGTSLYTGGIDPRKNLGRLFEA